jgi:error-prone DNA polymerase
LMPTCFYDIVVQVAIIRPGPIVGQMVHPYLNRRAGREPVTYPHPSLEPILARTLGVPLFQEQLLRIAMVAAGFSGGQAEDLRRAFGFKRSEKRMRQVEVQLRDGMAKTGITGDAAEQIIQSITSFALYGFPESHAASFALLAYASAYLKAHYPAAFYAALLNNQPMGFYHPATIVKDAQRHGVRFRPIDVQQSDWLCTIEEDGSVRLGLMYVTGLREDVGRAMANVRPRVPTESSAKPRGDHFEDRAERSDGEAIKETERSAGMTSSVARRCPKCGSDDESMIETVSETAGERTLFCNTCAHDWHEFTAPRRFATVDDLVQRTKVRREEIQVLAEIGALNAFGYHRREALWQAERAVRPAGELFETVNMTGDDARTASQTEADEEPSRDPERQPRLRAGSDRSHAGMEPHAPAHDAVQSAGAQRGPGPCPLAPMSDRERLLADYGGTGLTIGPHPMTARRSELATRGVLRAIDLPRGRHGRRVRVAGTVITRQRPGTAKGFVFLTLEDETGIANVIVRPDLFASQRTAIVSEPFLLVEGILQIQDGVTSVKAERVEPIEGTPPIDVESHDFH